MAVVLLNDDDTTMHYVVFILKSVFSLSEALSREIMITAHLTGSALVGLYPETEALALIKLVDAKNRQSGNRLRCLIVDPS